jgi:hypothetical protein
MTQIHPLSYEGLRSAASTRCSPFAWGLYAQSNPWSFPSPLGNPTWTQEGGGSTKRNGCGETTHMFTVEKSRRSLAGQRKGFLCRGAISQVRRASDLFRPTGIRTLS